MTDLSVVVGATPGLGPSHVRAQSLAFDRPELTDSSASRCTERSTWPSLSVHSSVRTSRPCKSQKLTSVCIRSSRRWSDYSSGQHPERMDHSRRSLFCTRCSHAPPRSTIRRRTARAKERRRCRRSEFGESRDGGGEVIQTQDCT